MSPISVVKQLLKVEQNTAVIILSGMAVVAAAVIVLAWRIRLEDALIAGGSIAAMGVAVYLVSNIVADKVNKIIIGRSLSVLFVGALGVLFISAVSPNNGFIAPFPCLIRPHTDCRTELQRLPENAASERIVDAVAPSRPEPTTSTAAPPAAAAAGVRPSDYRVFVQFAGVIRREDVIKMATRLSQAGWQIQGRDRGGERTPAAAGVNQVRFSGDANVEGAATLLAQQVTQAGLGGSPVQAVRNAQIPAGTLEVWISR